MRCLECDRIETLPGLMLAMEQRQHFAMLRNTTLCTMCAYRLFCILAKVGRESRYWTQSMDCAFCGSNLPVMRLRFEVKDRVSRHIAVCEKCYNSLRDELLKTFNNLIGFIEKEWHRPDAKPNVREPWHKGTPVRVKPTERRFSGRVGTVLNHRILTLPWFGYDVLFDDGRRQFFHERDLEPLGMSSHGATGAG